MRYTTPLLIIPFAILLGCGKNSEYEPTQASDIPVATIAPGKERTLAPLVVGNQWVYTLQQGASKTEITMKVEEVSQTPDGNTEATIGVYQGDGQKVVVDQKMVWRVTDAGVYQVTTGTDTVYDPPQLLIPFPPTKDAETVHEGTGGRPIGGAGPFKATMKVLGPQEADTGGGRMSAFAIQSVTEWETDDGPVLSNTITWWRPEIGFIRQVQEVRTSAGTVTSVMKLKSHSFPRSTQ